MASYAFMRPGTMEPVPFDEVNKKLCDMLGLMYRKDKLHGQFDDMVEIGFGILMSRRSGGDGYRITPDVFDRWREWQVRSVPVLAEPKWASLFDVYRVLLAVDYNFYAAS